MTLPFFFFFCYPQKVGTMVQHSLANHEKFTHIRFGQILTSQHNASHLSHRWPCLNKTTLCLSCYFQEFIKQHLWFPFLKSCIPPRHPFTAHSHRLSITALTNQTAMAQPASSMHTRTQACHSHGMCGMHPPHQRMICIHSVGWASHSGAHPQGLKICKTATHPTTRKLASTALCVLPSWVRGRNTFGWCWWGQTTVSSPEVNQGCRSPHYSLMWDAQIRWSS